MACGYSRNAPAQPFKHLGRAWLRFFADIKAGERITPESKHLCCSLRQQGVNLAYLPTFKRKCAGRDSFYVSNDKFNTPGAVV